MTLAVNKGAALAALGEYIDNRQTRVLPLVGQKVQIPQGLASPLPSGRKKSPVREPCRAGTTARSRERGNLPAPKNDRTAVWRIRTASSVSDDSADGQHPRPSGEYLCFPRAPLLSAVSTITKSQSQEAGIVETSPFHSLGDITVGALEQRR